jgi:hypothetical protein
LSETIGVTASNLPSCTHSSAPPPPSCHVSRPLHSEHMQDSPDTRERNGGIWWLGMSKRSALEARLEKQHSRLVSSKIRVFRIFSSWSFIDCGTFAGWRGRGNGSGFDWNQHWAATAASRSSRAPANSWAGICMDRGLLVSGRKALQVAPRLLVAAAIPCSALGRATP